MTSPPGAVGKAHPPEKCVDQRVEPQRLDGGIARRRGNGDPDGLPPLDATPGHLIRQAQQVHWNLWTAHVDTDLTSVQYGLLLVVGQRPGIDQRAIGERMSLDKSNTADVVSRLGRRGLVTRERDVSDARRKLVRLTEAGHAALVRLAPAVVDVQDRILEPLSFEDGETLIRLLRLVAYGGEPPSLDPGAEHNAAVQNWPLRLPALRLHTTPGHLIRRAQQVHTTFWAELVGAESTSVQYNILLVLHHRPRIDQRSLGIDASLDKSTAGEVITRLVARGLIARERDPADARRKVLHLSEAGRRVLFDQADMVFAVQQALLAPLASDQRELFLSLMSRIAHTGE